MCVNAKALSRTYNKFSMFGLSWGVGMGVINRMAI